MQEVFGPALKVHTHKVCVWRTKLAGDSSCNLDVTKRASCLDASLRLSLREPMLIIPR
jgi:hypothetical protein